MALIDNIINRGDKYIMNVIDYNKKFINTVYSYKEGIPILSTGLFFHHDNDRYYVERTNEYTKDKFRFEVSKNDDEHSQYLKFKLDIYKNDVKTDNNIYIDSEETIKLLSLICTYYESGGPSIRCIDELYFDFDNDHYRSKSINLNNPIETIIEFKDIYDMIHPSKLKEFIIIYVMAVNKACNDENQSNLPQQKTGKWIPCSDRMPEKEGRYWVWAEQLFVPDHVDAPNSYQGDTVASFLNGNWYGEMIGRVYAWMPLPEPYRR